MDQTLFVTPDTVQAVLASRIDRLDPVQKQLLPTRSVIGARIPFDLLWHVFALDANALDLCLGKLEETGFLLEKSVIPMRTCRFKHTLPANLPNLLDQVDGRIGVFPTAGAFDEEATYVLLTQLAQDLLLPEVVLPPRTKSVERSGPTSARGQRDRYLETIAGPDRMTW